MLSVLVSYCSNKLIDNRHRGQISNRAPCSIAYVQNTSFLDAHLSHVH